MRWLVALLLLTSSALAEPPALAQQATQSTQDQLATTYANIGMQLAKQLDIANAKIADLQKQLDAAKPKAESTPTATPK